MACCILFIYRPRGDFRGFDADGRRLEFAEHVFSGFREGRIATVTPLIDRTSVAAQLGV